MALPPRGNRMPSHRIHTYCVCPPTDFPSSGGLLPPPQQRVSHRIRRSHRSLCWEYSPTDFTLTAYILPQISQNSQNFLLRIFSHRFHRIHRTSCWEYSPTDFTEFTELLAEFILPQISQNYTELLAEYILPQISQISQMVRVPSRGCTCLKCTNRARSAPTEQNRYSPTESTELTELLAECILPQISL